MPALAAAKYFVIVDTVGSCSIVQSLPATGLSAGKEAASHRRGDCQHQSENQRYHEQLLGYTYMSFNVPSVFKARPLSIALLTERL
jgi:hypothetical protein